jgi:hypothetical protein
LCLSRKIAPFAGSDPDIAIHVKVDFKSLPEPDWSVQKTNASYYGKLILALHDLKCSGLAYLSPNSNERKSFDTLLDYFSVYPYCIRGFLRIPHVLAFDPL